MNSRPDLVVYNSDNLIAYVVHSDEEDEEDELDVTLVTLGDGVRE